MVGFSAWPVVARTVLTLCELLGHGAFGCLFPRIRSYFHTHPDQCAALDRGPQTLGETLELFLRSSDLGAQESAHGLRFCKVSLTGAAKTLAYILPSFSILSGSRKKSSLVRTYFLDLVVFISLPRNWHLTCFFVKMLPLWYTVLIQYITTDTLYTVHPV